MQPQSPNYNQGQNAFPEFHFIFFFFLHSTNIFLFIVILLFRCNEHFFHLPKPFPPSLLTHGCSFQISSSPMSHWIPQSLILLSRLRPPATCHVLFSLFEDSFQSGFLSFKLRLTSCESAPTRCRWLDACWPLWFAANPMDSETIFNLLSGLIDVFELDCFLKMKMLQPTLFKIMARATFWIEALWHGFEAPGF